MGPRRAGLQSFDPIPAGRLPNDVYLTDLGVSKRVLRPAFVVLRPKFWAGGTGWNL
jgi:hypothetical protein